MIDKPEGPTSHDVVRQVRRRLGATRAGHTGTLDPMATGVLPVVLGEATKLVRVLVAGDKTYEAEATLGAETDTLDRQGRVTRMAPAETWPTDAEAIARAVAALGGRRRQRPPAYSAVKVGGRPLHERTRSGEAVEAPDREIEVYEAACLGVDLGPAPGPIGGGPRVRFRVACSKGTYVRSLAAELGRALGCGAYLSALRRLRSGPFGLDQAVSLASLEDEAGRRAAVRALVRPEEAVGHLAAVSLDSDAAARLTQGQAVAWPPSGGAPPGPGSLVRVAAAGRPLLALAEVGAGRGGHPVLRPVRVLNA